MRRILLGYDDDDRGDDPSTKKVVYPPRLMVDFTTLGVHFLDVAESPSSMV